MSVVTEQRSKSSKRRAATEAEAAGNGESQGVTDPLSAGETGSVAEGESANCNGDDLHATDDVVAMLKRGNGRQRNEFTTASDDGIDSICRSLQSLERQRRFALKQCIRGQNAITAFVAWNACGFHTGIPSEEERGKLWIKAGKLIKSIDSGETAIDCEGGVAADDDVASDSELSVVSADDSGDEGLCDTDQAHVAGVVRISQISRQAWSNYEKGLVDEMVRLAGQLPVAPWLSEPECRGISLGMLATIVGESGNLSNYPNPAKLWRRLFGAPIEKNGKTMMPSRWRLEKGLSSEEWEEAGYSPQRHATMQQLKENIVRQNGDGPYRKRYDEAKERTCTTHPEWWICSKCDGKGKVSRKKCQNCKGTGEVKSHPHNHAQLLAAKRFVRDLWNRWHGREFDNEVVNVPR